MPAATAALRARPHTLAPFQHLGRSQSNKQELASLIAQVQAEPKAPRKPPAAEVPARVTAPALPHGWYGWGFFPDKIYRTQNLIHFYRGMFPQYRPHQEAPPVPWYLRRPLLSWLNESGHRHCQAVIRFAFEEWDTVKFELQVDDGEVPQLNVIYGYRRMLARLMAQEKRSWGSNVTQWDGEEDHAETVVFA